MAVEYIGKNADDGMCFGLTSSDKIAFFGGTPSAQATITTIATNATIATAVASIRALEAELRTKGLIA